MNIQQDREYLNPDAQQAQPPDFYKSSEHLHDFWVLLKLHKPSTKMAEADIRAFFAEHDADGNGNLSQAEIKNLLTKLEVPEERCEVISKVCFMNNFIF